MTTPLHYSNTWVQREVGRIYYYSPDGKIIGYSLILYSPDEFTGFNVGAATSWTDLAGFVVAVGAQLAESAWLSWGTLAVTGLDILNNMTEYNGHLWISPMIPINEVPPFTTPEDELLYP